jgi:tetratricopeptide (TPR) repeat protein
MIKRITFCLTILFAFSHFHSLYAAEQVSEFVAHVQTIHDSLTQEWQISSGEEHSILTYQLGVWTRDPQYSENIPWNDRTEALYDMAMSKRGHFQLSKENYPVQENSDNHITPPHWSKALRDMQGDLIGESYVELQKSYYYHWHGILDEIAFLAEGALAQQRYELDSALVAYKKSFEICTHPLVKGESLIGTAEILVNKKEYQSALDTLTWAIENGGFSDNALFKMGQTLIRLGRVRESIDIFLLTLKVNPYHEMAHYYLGNGYTPLNYTQLSEHYPDSFPDEEQEEELQIFRMMLKDGRRVEAREQLSEFTKNNPDLIEPHILLAEISWLEGEYSHAETYCLNALDLCNDYGRAHAIIAKIQEGRRLHLSLRRDLVCDAFEDLPMPIVPGIEEYVVNWNELHPRHQKRVALSIEPWKHFIPVLVETGQTHYIKPLHELLCQAPGMESLEDQRIGLDSRLWDDVRGAGGYNTVTGIEDVERLVFGGYNTVLHELTHQVHSTLTDPEKQLLDEAYRNAKSLEKDGTETFLSQYQGSTVWEYFAEGANSYNTKKIDEFDNSDVVYERLIEMDTTLLNIVEHFLFEVSDMAPYFTVGFVNAAYQQLVDGRADLSQEMIDRIPSESDSTRSVLQARSSIAAILDNDLTAIETAQSQITLFPNEATGYLQLVSALTTSSEYSDSLELKILTDGLSMVSEEEKISFYSSLGSYYWLNEDYETSIAWYDSLLAVQGDHPHGLWGRAVSLSDLSVITGDTTQYNESLKDFARVIQIRSGIANLRLDYARALIEHGDYESADVQISEAEALRPGSPLPKTFRAWLTALEGDLDSAKEILAEIITLDPVPDITQVFASAYEVEGAIETALLETNFKENPQYYVFNPKNYGYETHGEWLPWYSRVSGE